MGPVRSEAVNEGAERAIVEAAHPALPTFRRHRKGAPRAYSHACAQSIPSDARARQCERVVAVSKRLRFEVLRRDNHACRYCGRTAPDVKLTVDHVNPEALGGRTEPANLVTACTDCNAGKSATTPDAALVDDVAQDALRWARARAVAASALLADLEERKQQRTEFERVWNTWGLGEGEDRKTVPLPIEWPNSIDQFLAAGLPMPVLLDCLSKAWRTTKLKPENIFRYMCGIAWNTVTEMQDAANSAVGSTAAATEDDSSAEWVELLDETLRELPEEHVDALINKVQQFEDEPIPAGPGLTVQVACSAISNLWFERQELVRQVKRLLAQLPAEEAAEYEEAVRTELTEHLGGDWTEADVAAGTLAYVAAYFAAQRLHRLPELERQGWLACAAAWMPSADEHRLVLAASEYAWEYKHEGTVPRVMCVGPGDHGTRCPRRATYRVRYANCRLCRGGSCAGHTAWCGEHMERVIDGELGSEELIDYDEIRYDDPWGG